MSIEGNAAPPGLTPGFTVGRVIAMTFSVLFGNIIRFVAIILIVGVPVIGFLVGGSLLLSAEVTTSGSRVDFTFNAATGFETAFGIASGVLAALGYLLVLSALVHATVESMAGRPVSIIGSLSASFSALPRTSLAAFLLIVTGLLIGLMAMIFVSLVLSILGATVVMISIASSLLILMVSARILLFIPAIMIERAAVLESFGRSQELTREHRWGLFGILLLVAVVNWMIPFASAAFSAVSPEAGNALNIGFAIFFVAFVGVLIGVAFHVLRTGKEGAPAGEIAKVFD